MRAPNSPLTKGEAPEARGLSGKAGKPGGKDRATTATPPPVKRLRGRDALLRVRDARLNTDAEHRVPTESRFAGSNQFLDKSPAPKGGI